MTGLDVLTLAIILAVVASVVFFAMLLAGLPGKIARQRRHPQADAISVAGWLSLLSLFILWPVALIWAYSGPLNVHVSEQPEATTSGKGRAPA